MFLPIVSTQADGGGGGVAATILRRVAQVIMVNGGTPQAFRCDYFSKRYLSTAATASFRHYARVPLVDISFPPYPK
jgi:hypothetical protein